MIDWVTAKLPCDNNLRSGCVAKLDADGNVDSNFDAVELDGSTVDASGTRDGIMESLTRATNF